MSRRSAVAPGHSRWLKAVIVLAFLTPPLVSRGFSPSSTPAVIQAVLAHPVINDVTWLLVLTKYGLLAVTIACLVRPTLLGRWGWGYYASVLVVIAVGQNIAHTDDYGWAWLMGNTIIQLVVAGFAASDALAARTRARTDQLRRGRLWVLIPMALAWLFPYVLRADDAVPGMTCAALINESGVTYCMVTPVVLGLMILYSDGVHSPTLAVAAWVGLLFGVTNMMVWFALTPASWWMGVLHVPLLVVSAYAAWLARRPRRAQ